jgi:FHA domain/FhaA, N-terminal domain
MPQGLTHSLVEAMRSGVRPGVDGVLVAPNLYIIQVHPDQVEALLGTPEFMDELVGLLRQASLEGGLQLSGPLSLRVEPGWDLSPGQVRVSAIDSLQDLSPTSGLALNPETPLPAIPLGAFLIVDGMRVYPLEVVVVNIGRREDNHLVIDDPRVSRLHAQLRIVRGQYVIFDLDSTGGTFVNGLRIHQYTLRAGDVISLAGVPLVFGQEIPEPGDTQEVPAE